MEDSFSHVIKKGMNHPEGLFLERKFDSDNLHTIPIKPKSAFSLEKVCSKKEHFEDTIEELPIIIKYMKHHYFEKVILVFRIHVLSVVFLSLIFVFFLSYQFIPATTMSLV